jgi:PIN domain nuclease of toxin-antitoxin system
MRVLLDTHILLWALLQPARLGAARRRVLESPENRIYFSAVNIWEIAIKRALDRPDFTAEPAPIRAAALDTGFEELPVSGEHAAGVRGLPDHHRDPFDRLLIAQARHEPLLLMSDDPLVSRYAVPLIGASASDAV